MREEALDLANYVVEKGRRLGFDEVASIVRISRRVMVKFANNEITVVQNWMDTTIALYLVKEAKCVLTRLVCRTKNDIDRALKNVYDHMAHVEPSALYAPLPEPNGKTLEGLTDPKLVQSLGTTIEVVPQLIDEGLREGAQRLAGTFHAGHRIKALVTSKGAELSEEGTFIEVYARAFYEDNSGHWAWTSTKFNDDRVLEVGRKAASYSKIRLPVTRIEPGRYNAILSPLVVGNLMSYVARAASALATLLGLSMFTKYKPGTKIGSEIISIIDEPRDPLLPNSTGFDDEGIETRTKYIIRKGIFESYLHNTKTATRMRGQLTGNAGWLQPHPWNVVVEPGDVDEDDIFCEVGEGIFVLNNWYTRYQNIVEGQFSTVSRDVVLYVKGGEPKSIIRRVRIAEVFPNLLNNIVGLTKTKYDVAWWEVKPPVRVPFVIARNMLFTRPEV